MVKAKELKVLRKGLDHLLKSTSNPLEAIMHQNHQNYVISRLQSNDNNGSAISNDDDSIVKKMSTVNLSLMEVPIFQIVTSASAIVSSDAIAKPKYLVYYYSSLTNQPIVLRQCLQLFTENMKELYEKSSWGYDITTKQAEFLHPNARFIVLVDGAQEESFSVTAFVHFRFCYNDDDDPSELVLYVHELQVLSRCQKQGIGQYCMQIIQQIAENTNGNFNVMTSKATAPVSKLSKIMLTVFRKNHSAMHFYIQKLHYQIDPSSPSCYNQVEDYEILSKTILI